MHAGTWETSISESFCRTREDSPRDGRGSPEIELVRRIQAGDEAAFRDLVETYQARIHRLAFGILHNPQDAEEIAQEVFAKVYFSIRNFDCRSSLYTWMYRIASNECFARLRKKRVTLVFESQLPADAPALDLNGFVDVRPTADRTVAQRDLVAKLLARMPAKDRTLLLWREVEGLSVAQVAAMTGLKENTVKAKLFRARQKLAETAARLARRATAVDLRPRRGTTQTTGAI